MPLLAHLSVVHCNSFNHLTYPRERLFACIVFDVFVFELRGEFGGEIIHLHDHPANARDQEIVTEHRRNRDAERSDGSDERARNAGRHRCQVGRPCHCHVGERVHYTPNRAEQSEEGRAADRRRQQDHL